MNEGYIKLFRKFTTWEWYDDINTSRLFLHLLMTVNWQDKSWQKTVVKKGSIITSISKLSEETKLTPRQVRSALEKLKLTNELTIKTTNRFTLITVVKYADYQCFDIDNGKQNGKQNVTQMTNKRQTKCHSNDTPVDKQNVIQTTNKKSSLSTIEYADYQLLSLNNDKQIDKQIDKQNVIQTTCQLTTTKEEKNKRIEEYNNTFLNENKLNELNNQEKPTLFELFEDEFKRPLTQVEMQRLFDWQTEHGEQLVMYALREAILNNAYHFNYIDKILSSWKREGMTVEKYEEALDDE